jgi:chromosome segregation ATPase
MRFFLAWARERIDEMDATLASFESKLRELEDTTRAEADRSIDALRAQRGAFRDAVAKQARAGEAAWTRAKDLESQWAGFETDVGRYFEKFGKQVEQQQATFQMLAAAQMKAWREVADTMQQATREVAGDRRGDIEAAAARIKADAAAAQAKLEKVPRTGFEPWSTFTTALAETRAAFDRANQAARSALK